MKPGRELDVLIAEKVMGWNKTLTGMGYRWSHPGMHPLENCKDDVKPYSTDISAAWEVLTCGKWTWDLAEMDDSGLVSCYLENEDEGIWARELGQDAPHAICLTALKAIESSE